MAEVWRLTGNARVLSGDPEVVNRALKGVGAHHATSVRLASLVMLLGVVTSATYLAYLMRTARQPVAATRRRP
jgi:hypothetical protein